MSIKNVLASLAVMVPMAAQAQSVSTQTYSPYISGAIRSYFDSQTAGGTTAPNKYAYALGGNLSVTTPAVDGISGAATLYFGSGLGINDTATNFEYLDPLLIGDRQSIAVLGQDYLQYHNAFLTIRAGNQLIVTPWVNPSDAFLVPSTFTAIYAAYRPAKHFRLVAFRSFAFKNRTSTNFTHETLLNQNAIYPHIPTNNNGILAAGLTYTSKTADLSAWAYKFYNIADLYYANGKYELPSYDQIRPYMAAQVAHERADGIQSAGPVDATAYGLMAGLRFGLFNIFSAFDRVIPHQVFSVGGRGLDNGGFVSPYTEQYSSDPLYTSDMDYGLVAAAAAGNSYKFGVVYRPLKNLRLKYAYSIYDTQPYLANVDANYVGISYIPTSGLRGLSIVSRLQIDHGNPFSGYRGTLYDERLMVQYKF